MYIIPTIKEISSGATELVAVDMIDYLDGAELMTGTPTITEQNTTDLTLSNKVVSTAELVIDDRTCAIGKALQFKVVGQVAGRIYVIELSCATTSSPARTASFGLQMRCV